MTTADLSSAITTPTLKRFYDSEQALKDIRTYHPDISIDLMRQAGLFAYYSSLLVQAESQHDRIENLIDIVAAKLDRKVRDEAAIKGKMTESQIKAAITISPHMVTLAECLRQAREEVGYLKGTCEALRQRKDALMQIALLSREELKGSPTVMASTNRENRNERLKVLSEKDPFISMPNYD